MANLVPVDYDPFAPQQTAPQQPAQSGLVPVDYDPFAQPENKRSFGKDIGRQVGLAARYIPEGLANTAGLVTNPITAAMQNAGMNVEPVPKAVSRLLDKMGLPKPETATERVVGDISRAVSGTGGVIGTGQKMAGMVGQQLAAAPISQVGAASGSAAAGGTAREMGASEPVQLAANLLGGVVGGKAGSSIGAKTGIETAVNNAAPARKTAQDLRSEAGKIYQEAADKGGTLKPETTNKFLDGISSMQPQTQAGQMLAGEDPFTKVAGNLSQLRGRPLSLAEAQEIDEYLTNSIDTLTEFGKPTKQGLKLMNVQRNLRDIINNATPDDVTDTAQGFEALKKGREIWAKSARLRDVEAIMQKAENMEQPATAIKSGFRALYNNPNKMRGYTDAERKAIKAATQTGIGTDALRLLGSGLVPIGAGIAGTAVTGPIGGASAGLFGLAAQTAGKKLATKSQMTKAEKVAELIAGGALQKPLTQIDQQKLGRYLGTIIGSQQGE